MQMTIDAILFMKKYNYFYEELLTNISNFSTTEELPLSYFFDIAEIISDMKAAKVNELETVRTYMLSSIEKLVASPNKIELIRLVEYVINSSFVPISNKETFLEIIYRRVVQEFDTDLCFKLLNTLSTTVMKEDLPIEADAYLKSFVLDNEAL